MNSGLPVKNITKKSDEDVRLFFDKYLTKSINFNDNELNSVVGFFENKGFDKSSAISVSIVLLQQAKLDNIKIFKLIDTLNGYQNIQLSAVVAEVLNYNRKRTSAVGFKRENTDNRLEKRNIIEGSPAPVIINSEVQNNFSATGFTFDSRTNTWDGA
jgi:hypothetical protein|tara:strand:- start:5659 stop:6129 length:471 start_codon:yes stop_codon:yes gene_type:complete